MEWTPACHSTSLHTGSQGESVSNERGEEGLFGGRCWGWCRLTGGGQECDLAQTQRLLYCECRGGKKKLDKADSIKEQEQVTETENISHEPLLTWLQAKGALLHLSKHFLRWGEEKTMLQGTNANWFHCDILWIRWKLVWKFAYLSDCRCCLFRSKKPNHKICGWTGILRYHLC